MLHPRSAIEGIFRSCNNRLILDVLSLRYLRKVVTVRAGLNAGLEKSGVMGPGQEDTERRVIRPGSIQRSEWSFLSMMSL